MTTGAVIHQPRPMLHDEREIWFRVPCSCGWLGCWWGTEEKAWRSYQRHQAMPTGHCGVVTYVPRSSLKSDNRTPRITDRIIHPARSRGYRMRFSDAVKEWLTYLRTQRKGSPWTQRSYQSDMTHVLRRIPKDRCDQITEEFLQAQL